jgi:hypothetical protein
MFERKTGAEFEEAWNIVKADFIEFWARTFSYNAVA